MNISSHTLNIKTKYSVVDLIKYLKKNLEIHKEEYEKATEVYRADVVTALKALEKSTKKAETDLTEVRSTYQKLLNIPKPVDATKLYEQYISILSVSTESTLELTVEDANAIINDAWEWAISAKAVNNTFSTRYVR